MERLWQPEDKWFTDGNLKLHYLDWGNPTAMPMVLLHHHTGIARYWDSFAQGFRQEYHIIAVDQRGHGDSSWMGSYNHQEYADDLAKFVDNLGLDDMVLIGHSLGGINSIIYTASHPERVAQLVIVDIGPEINIEGTQDFRKRMYSMPEAFASEEEAGRQLKQVNPRYSDDLIRHLISFR